MGNFLKNLRINLLVFTIIVAIVSIVMAFMYFYKFGENGLSETTIEWANFGNYLASITGLLAFSGVLFSAYLSEKRAHESGLYTYEALSESKRREERDIFYRMLERYLDNAKNLAFTDGSTSLLGAEAFDKYVSIINNIFIDYSMFECVRKLNAEDLASIEKQNRDLFNINLYQCCSNIYNHAKSDNKIVKQPSTTVQYYQFVKDNLHNEIDNYFFHHPETFRSDNSRMKEQKSFLENFGISEDFEYMQNSLRFVGNVFMSKFGNIFSKYFSSLDIILPRDQNTFDSKEEFNDLLKSHLSSIELVFILLYINSLKASKDFITKVDKSKILRGINFNDFALVNKNSEWKGKEQHFIDEIFRKFEAE